MVRKKLQVTSIGTNNGTEYTINNTVYHEPQDHGTVLYMILWYYIGEKYDTLEGIQHSPRSELVQYQW